MRLSGRLLCMNEFYLVKSYKSRPFIGVKIKFAKLLLLLDNKVIKRNVWFDFQLGMDSTYVGPAVRYI